MQLLQPRPSSIATPCFTGSGALCSLTIAAVSRGTNVCTRDGTPKMLMAAAAHYHATDRWFIRLLLIMPDHLHALIAFRSDRQRATVVTDWKRYTSLVCDVEWQHSFCVGSVRDDEACERAADYIRENPVRKGLVSRRQDWPWVLEGLGR